MTQEILRPLPKVIISSNILSQMVKSGMNLDYVATGREHFLEFVEESEKSSVPMVFFKACSNIVNQTPVSPSDSDCYKIDSKTLARVASNLYGRSFKTLLEANYALNYGFVMAGIKHLKNQLPGNWNQEELIKIPVFTARDTLLETIPVTEGKPYDDSINPFMKSISNFKLDLYEGCGALIAAEQLVNQPSSLLEQIHGYLNKLLFKKDRLTPKRLTSIKKEVEEHFSQPPATSRLILLTMTR